MGAGLRNGVAASNALTSRWIGSMGAGAGNFVASGAAVWPLLAVLASGADGRIREGLERAIGLPPEDALDEAVRMLDWLRRDGDTNAALGIWVRDDIPIERRWRARLPRGVLGQLTGDPGHDQATLDAWVREETRAIIDELSVQIQEDTLMLLAQAIALRTEWSRPFEAFRWQPGSGPWRDRELHGLRGGGRADQVLLLETDERRVTTFRTNGEAGVDVYLILGDEGMTPSDVLVEAIDRLAAGAPGRPGSDLQVGETAPGLVVVEVEEEVIDDRAPALRVRTVGFDVQSRHDLLAVSGVFGLEVAAREPNFSGISHMPLIVGQAAQAARAKFTASGFEAAAVTGLIAELGIPERARRRFKVVEVSFDRPFGFIALDRISRLVLFAGWVDDPEPWSPELEEMIAMYPWTRR